MGLFTRLGERHRAGRLRCAAVFNERHRAGRLRCAAVFNERHRAGRLRRGYTLIELIVVMAIISVLLAIAVPLYQKSIQRTKESLLKSNLFTLRNVIDEYTFDKKKAPQRLEDLVSEGYLRNVPVDPLTGNDHSWRIVMEDAYSMVDQTQAGIFDVHSGSDQKSSEGTLYSQW